MGTNPGQTSQNVRGSLISALKQTYRDGNHVNLQSVIASNAIGGDDDALADLIDADGRLRLSQGLDVSLARYLEAIPELAVFPAALDTAIEMTLRSMERGGLSQSDAASALLVQYPNLASAIGTSSTLSQVLCSTEAVRRSLVGGDRALPCDMGPALPDGRIRYELRELIGTGSHGAVYLATDRQLSDPDRPAWVAVKVLSALTPDEQFRLADEAAKARRVNHPNVVRVLDRSISDEGEMFLVYEHVRGGNLENFVARSGPPTVRQAVRLVAELADGLQAAHSSGLAHCDIKPANVLLTDDGKPKIADFGVAVRIGANTQSAAPRRLGSLAFMAPEQYRGEEGALTPLADVYSLGGLLFWMITGKYPNGDSPEQVQENLAGASPRLKAPDPNTHKRVERDLAAVCRKAMEPDSARRFQSAEAFGRDLRSWLASKPVQCRRSRLTRRALLFTKRQPVTVLLAILVVASSAIGTGVAVLNHQKGLQREMQLRMERQSRAQFQRLLDSTATVLTSSGSADDWLPMMTILETAFGPALGGAAGGDIWTPRINQAHDFIAKAKAANRGNELEPMMWQVVLGYWLLRAERPADAAEILRDAREQWAKIAAPSDAWLRDIDAMLACAEARRAIQTREGLQDAADALEAISLETEHWTLGRSIQRVLLNTRMELYGAELLNQPAKAKDASKKLKSIK